MEPILFVRCVIFIKSIPAITHWNRRNLDKHFVPMIHSIILPLSLLVSKRNRSVFVIRDIIYLFVLISDNELYSGTVADFSGTDPIIYRETLQTEQYDSLSLNAPNFVGSFTQGDFVYFFFRETAVEYINCGKAVFSRVARVCKWDKGGPHRFRNRWTSFLKSRLNCSMPGEYPFYFNEIRKYKCIMKM